MSLISRLARYFSTKTPYFYQTNAAIRKIIDTFIAKQPSQNLFPPLPFGKKHDSVYISKVDLYALLKQTPGHQKDLIFEFLTKKKNITVDYSDYTHRLESSVLVQYPPRCLNGVPTDDEHEVVLYTDASSRESGSNVFFIGAVILKYDVCRWKAETISTQVTAKNISEAEALAAKHGLEYLVQQSLHLKKVLHCSDCDTYNQRVRRFVMTPDVNLFSFWSDLFDLMRKFKHLTCEAVYREGNLADYPANILRLQNLLKAKGEDEYLVNKVTVLCSTYKVLVDDFLEGKPYFVFRYKGYDPIVPPSS